MSDKKLKIPKSVTELKLSPKKFAKKHGIKLKGKDLTKGEKKRNLKRLKTQYSEAAIRGLDRAVKILAENDSESKKIIKIKNAVDNIISNAEAMKRIAKIYKKNPKDYGNMIYLPFMIMNTILYYSQDSISDEDKEVGKSLDTEGLMEFCEKILKSEIKRYKKLGLDAEMAYHMATVIPTTKVFKSNMREWQRRLLQTLYLLAEKEEIDLGMILNAVCRLDKKGIDKKLFYEGFFSEVILMKDSNKNKRFTDSQKDLHAALIEKTLEYLDGLKTSRCKEIMKKYIKRRKTAESYKNDTKRIIKFVDYANSNSPYTKLKSVLNDLIADNSANELYLG
jgi:hypothetical protein